MDRHHIVVGGAEATVKWGYYTAMRLGAWRFEGGGSWGGTVTAIVSDRDELRSSQAPLTLILPFGLGSTRWPILDIREDEGTAVITVGPRER